MSETLYLVAGPCSAESAEQVMQCAAALREREGVSYLRAGVWKPRTRPGGFEGYGVRALPWLERAQAELGLPVCVEVATVEHVRLALAHGICAFWIGARTSADPFAVEALARAIPVGVGSIFVKNPISPDVSLWVGALERFARCGHGEIVGVLRGFYPSSPSVYRNEPGWEVALDLRSRLPHVRLLCDPSHIAGRVDLVSGLSQRAMDYSFDGLFVEVHPDPPRALSDGGQQLTPSQFWQMVGSLRVCGPLPAESDESVRRLRAVIDTLDERMLDLLVERMRVVGQIGEWKKARNVRSYDSVRWGALLRHHTRYAFERGLGSDFIRKLFSIVHSESLRVQGAQRSDGGAQGEGHMDKKEE